MQRNSFLQFKFYLQLDCNFITGCYNSRYLVVYVLYLIVSINTFLLYVILFYENKILLQTCFTLLLNYLFVREHFHLPQTGFNRS